MTAVKENPDEEEDGPAWQAYERNRDAISAASPQTLAGMTAKARAAKLEATFWDRSENVHGTMGEPWAWIGEQPSAPCRRKVAWAALHSTLTLVMSEWEYAWKSVISLHRPPHLLLSHSWS